MKARAAGWVVPALVMLTACLPAPPPRAVPQERAAAPVSAPVSMPASAPARAKREWPRPYTGELGRAEPNRVIIPRLKVSAPLVVLGIEADGSLAVPPLDHANVAGWFGGGPTPGERGSAVIAGHLDTRTGPAVFARLGELARGDVVGVARGDGTVAVFEVRRLERTPKAEFPADRVYGPARGRELRLVTCGGDFDRARRSYSHNVIVYALFSAAYLASDLR
ncbi:class F sortase [Nonomuraea soli]|uniref:Class F sortase n=1 Tax=Nonomuraea soli TaxID=1032476 RepID=A0A7W0CTQ4_9ACTN|nr:class F sortase [Nonomuraea soli]MBA2897184.1 hypothetical protein [Nonomuraea soli]